MKVGELRKTLELAKPGLGQSGGEALEQADSVVLKGGNLCSFNDEVAIVSPLPSDAGLDFDGAIPSDKLYKMLAKLPQDQEMTLSLSKDDSEIRVKCGRSNYGLKMALEVKLPIDEEITEPVAWTKLPEGFLNATKQCMAATGKSIEKPLLTCVHFTGQYVEGCDNHRMTRYECPGLPFDGLSIVAKNLTELSGYSPVEVGVAGNWVQFRSADGVKYCTRIAEAEGKYPDLSKHLAVVGKDIEFPPALFEALDRAAVCTEDEAKSKRKPSVKIEISNTGLIVSAMDSNGNWEKDGPHRMKYNGDTVRFEGNPDNLRDMLKVTTKVVLGERSLKIAGAGFVHVVAFRKGA